MQATKKCTMCEEMHFAVQGRVEAGTEGGSTITRKVSNCSGAAKPTCTTLAFLVKGLPSLTTLHISIRKVIYILKYTDGHLNQISCYMGGWSKTFLFFVFQNT